MADDHPLLRQALRNVLDQQADFEVVAEVGDGDEVVKVATELVPNVVIMDISMPKLNGLEATRQIKVKRPGVAILVLTVHGEAEHVLGLLEAGAAGYLTKSVFGEEVVQAIRAVVAGETVLSPASLHQILRHALRFMTKQPGSWRTHSERLPGRYFFEVRGSFSNGSSDCEFTGRSSHP